MTGRFFCALPLCVAAGQLLLAGDWPQFRGPQGDGHAAATGLPTTWGGFVHPPAWQAEIPGSGWSSPIAVGDRVWLTSAEQTALTVEALRKKLSENPHGELDFQAHASVTLFAVEVDAGSGKLLRRLDLIAWDDPPPIHVSNSYASPTPVTDGQRLYCHFGSLGTVGVDMGSGRVLWKRRFAVEEITGPGGSPVLDGELLILACDGADQQFLVAVNKWTGDTVWRTPRPRIDAAEGALRRAFSTPLVVEYGGRRQLISAGAQWVVGYDPASGRELWRASFGGGYAVVPRPVFRDGMVYVCTGYLKPELWAVRVDGSGDVTRTHVAWRYDRQVPEISSPVVVGNEIYFVSSKGVATCLEAESGRLLWQRRLGGNFAASPLAADGKLYFSSEEGTTIVLLPGREYRELARNQLFGRTLASLAVAGNSLLIRTDQLLYCVRQSPGPTGGR